MIGKIGLVCQSESTSGTLLTNYTYWLKRGNEINANRRTAMKDPGVIEKGEARILGRGKFVMP
jgi:hypothetical protein